MNPDYRLTTTVMLSVKAIFGVHTSAKMELVAGLRLEKLMRMVLM
ncbi:MAG: hypothetical protein RR531_04610 [Longicatena sp.]